MSTTNSAAAAWLTQEAFDRLKAELDHLSGAGRAEIVQKIEAARQEGDLKENGGYHAAKEEQGKIEARIRQLTVLLRDAHVGESPADDGIVEPGMIVVARIAMLKDELPDVARVVLHPVVVAEHGAAVLGAQVTLRRPVHRDRARRFLPG